MALQESGNNPHMKGASGENGALQYMPNTWVCVSKQMTHKVLMQNARNEWYVSVLKVNDLLNKNPQYTAYHVAQIWNGSLCGSELPIAKSGINSKGIHYDTVAHARGVLRNYYLLEAKN